ncbi:MAG: GTPase ObgE [Candidatus Latescibacterota bacterium]
MFIDEVTLTVESGAGGDGCVSFRREKFVPRGGPDGGDGGDGGSVVLVADQGLSTLFDYHYRTHVRARRGEHGRGKNLTGARGQDAVLRVPAGTVVRGPEGGVIVDLVADGQRFVLLGGGRGGRGNARFATPQQQAPRRADPGQPGRQAVIILELKLLADVGLVGFPNAGKSTLLSRLSAAHPRIAGYPFTTLQPILGIVRWSPEDTFVMADLPGLIEGAHAGKGLGTRFLRHVERTRVLLFTLDCTRPDLPGDLATLRRELGEFNPLLLDKPYAVAFTKRDLLPPDAPFAELLPGAGGRHFLISAVTGEGLQEMVRQLGQMLQLLRRGQGEPKQRTVPW